MIESTKNEQAARFGHWVANRMRILEAILVLVLIISLVLRIIDEHPLPFLITVSLLVLALVYFFAAYAPLMDENAGSWEVFLNKLALWGCAVVLIGSMFRLENMAGHQMMLFIGIGTLLIVLPMIIINKLKKPELKIFRAGFLIRMAIFLLAGLFMAIVSSGFLEETGLKRVADAI